MNTTSTSQSDYLSAFPYLFKRYYSSYGASWEEYDSLAGIASSAKSGVPCMFADLYLEQLQEKYGNVTVNKDEEGNRAACTLFLHGYKSAGEEQKKPFNMCHELCKTLVDKE